MTEKRGFSLLWNNDHIQVGNMLEAKTLAFKNTRFRGAILKLSHRRYVASGFDDNIDPFTQLLLLVDNHGRLLACL